MEFGLKRGTKSFRSLARAAGSEEERPITWDEIREERVIVGTPTLVTERLRELRDLLGIDGILAEVNPGGKIPQPLVKRSLQLLCQDVLPAFR
jgi:alkanesulfonate monooxygenase SsuD/methylene tetrahydromethanopterin reductase-like flavin-dependent oxidoreductase (luciferase family)